MVSLITNVPISKEQKKTQKSYETAMNNAFALMKGDKNFKVVSKIPNDEVDKLIEELTKEQVEEKREEFKTKMKALFKKRVEFENLIEQKTKEFNGVITGKMKEFTKEVSEVVNIIQDINQIRASYLQAFGNNNDNDKLANEAAEEE